MKIRQIRLSTTPTQEALDELQLGDIVFLDGVIYTAREGVYKRALEDKANIPMDLPLHSATNFHCSPAARINPDGSFAMGAVGYGTGALLGRGIERVEAVHWEKELGIAQAMWVIRCNNMGPSIVSSDKEGCCLFERENDKIMKNLDRVYEGTRPATLKRYQL